MSLWGKEEALSVTGNVRIPSNGSTLTGATGTAVFLTQIKNGDTLVLGTTRYPVLTVDGDATLTLAGATGATGLQAAKVIQSPKYLSDSEKKTSVFGVDTNEVGIGATGATGAFHPAHAGWVKITRGTGGRAGRCTTEVLVAMGGIASDLEDVQFSD